MIHSVHTDSVLVTVLTVGVVLLIHSVHTDSVLVTVLTVGVVLHDTQCSY